MRSRAPSRLAFGVVLLSIAACNDAGVVAPLSPPSDPLAHRRSAPAPVPSGTGKVLSFDGVSSCAATAANAPVTTLTTNIRLEAFIKWAGPSTSPTQFIVYNGNSAFSGWGIFVVGNQVELLAGGHDVVETALTLAPGVWQHVFAELAANGDVTVRLDDQSYQGHMNAAGIGGHDDRTLIGCSGGSDAGTTASEVFNGLIDDVRISSVDASIIEEWTFEDATTTGSAGAHGASLTLRNVTITHVVIPVRLDIAPDHEGRVVEPEQGGRIEVAVLSTRTFDATTIDASTVRFGPAAATPIRSERSRVDRDHDRDMLYTFDLSATGLTCLDVTATLRAKTYGGVEVTGTDRIRTLATVMPANSYIVRCAAPRVIASEIIVSAAGLSVTSINDRGQVNGVADFGAGGVAFRWQNGALATQAVPNGFIQSVTRMNDDGDMAIGVSAPDGSSASAYLWTDRSLRRVNAEGTVIIPTAVNDGGEVLGWSDASLMFVWKRGQTTTLRTTPERPYLFPIGFARGSDVAGISFDTNFIAHAFLWNGRSVQQLSTPDEYAEVTAANKRGQLIGTGYGLDLAAGYPVMWSAAGRTQLSAEKGSAVLLNDRGDVVLKNQDGKSRVWRNGALTVLESANHYNPEVNDINELGEVTGIDGHEASFWRRDGSRIALTGGQFVGGEGFWLTGINNLGQVVGNYVRDGKWRVVLWTIGKEGR